MARQRFIWPELWDDPVLGRLPPDHLLLYIACFSLADDEGRLLGEPAWLRSHVFPYREFTLEEIAEMRDAVARASDSFLLYWVDGIAYIEFQNWFEFQKPKYVKPSKLPDSTKADHLSAKKPSRHGEIVRTDMNRPWVRRGYIKKHVRAAVYARDNNACVVCGSTTRLSIDHIQPVHLGGSNEPDNLRTICLSCNSKKGLKQDREAFSQNGDSKSKASLWVGLGRDGMGRAVREARDAAEKAGEQPSAEPIGKVIDLSLKETA